MQKQIDIWIEELKKKLVSCGRSNRNPSVTVESSCYSLGVVLAEIGVNLGNAFFSKVEGFNLLLVHANENFSQTGIGLLLRESCQFITQVFELL
jgi:hypothetical protein